MLGNIETENEWLVGPTNVSVQQTAGIIQVQL